MQKPPAEADPKFARRRALLGTASALVAWFAAIAVAWLGGWLGIAIVVLVASCSLLVFCLLLTAHERHDENDKALMHMVQRTQDAITRYAKIAAGKEP